MFTVYNWLEYDVVLGSLDARGERPTRRHHQKGASNEMKIFNFSINPKDIRRKLGLNQQEFWTRIGVTQSGGSRYESGREMPKPVQELLRLVHVEKLDLTRVKKEDFEVIEYLKQAQPDLFRNLKKAAKDKRGTKSKGGPNSEH
jgi:DNA-binding transcriptional regulator YiaG